LLEELAPDQSAAKWDKWASLLADQDIDTEQDLLQLPDEEFSALPLTAMLKGALRQFRETKPKATKPAEKKPEETKPMPPVEPPSSQSRTSPLKKARAEAIALKVALPDGCRDHFLYVISKHSVYMYQFRSHLIAPHLLAYLTARPRGVINAMRCSSSWSAWASGYE
jgi:hypothetical protein